VKLGLHNLALGVIAGHSGIYALGNITGKNVAEVLGCEKKEIAEFIKIDVTPDELKFYHHCREHGYFINTAIIEQIRKYKGNDKRWSNFELFQRIYRLELNISLIKLIDYAEKIINDPISEYKSEFNRDAVLIDWQDYIKNVQALGWDINNKQILYPNNLKLAHDEAFKTYKVIKNQDVSQKITNLFDENFARYSYSEKDYFITVPESYEELIDEGSKLHHCVATYAENVANQICVILFIRNRNNPKEPFFTAEIRDNKLWQIRGKCNCDPPADVKAFYELFSKKVLQKRIQQEVERLRVAV